MSLSRGNSSRVGSAFFAGIFFGKKALSQHNTHFSHSCQLHASLRLFQQKKDSRSYSCLYWVERICVYKGFVRQLARSLVCSNKTKYCQKCSYSVRNKTI